MAVRVATIAFEGVEARPVDVQVQISSGSVVFNVVGLGDKAVAESRERVRAALAATGQAEHTVIAFISDNGGPTPSCGGANSAARRNALTLWSTQRPPSAATVENAPLPRTASA